MNGVRSNLDPSRCASCGEPADTIALGGKGGATPGANGKAVEGVIATPSKRIKELEQAVYVLSERNAQLRAELKDPEVFRIPRAELAKRVAFDRAEYAVGMIALPAILLTLAVLCLEWWDLPYLAALCALVAGEVSGIWSKMRQLQNRVLKVHEPDPNRRLYGWTRWSDRKGRREAP